MSSEKKCLVIMTTVPATLKFHEGFIQHAHESGYDVHCITSMVSSGVEVSDMNYMTLHRVDMTREISGYKDLVSLLKITQKIICLKPDVLHVSTPKAALLGLIAGRICRTEKLVYTLRGVRYLGSAGVKRKILELAEKFTCSLAHVVISTSIFSRNEVIGNSVCNSSRIKVFGQGTGNGVDAVRLFNPELYDTERSKIKFIPKDDINSKVVLYVGRVVREKGINELVEAWSRISAEHAPVILILAGEVESHDKPSFKTLETIRSDSSIIQLGRIPHKEIPELLTICDLLVLPSYREGFGIAPLEANAMMKPVVVTRIDGLQEAVLDGETGLHVDVRSSEQLAEAVNKLLRDSELRLHLGSNGRDRVLSDFAPIEIWNSYLRVYSTT